MRQVSLTAMMLLISVPAVSAGYYHVRHATYACVDPRATLALNDPGWHHAAWRMTTRREGRCLRIRPQESWEQVSRPAHFLQLLRQTPARPGTPPLYFTSSSVAPGPPHDADRRPRRHHPELPIRSMARNSAAEVRTIPAAPAGLQIPAPVTMVAALPIAPVAARAAALPPTSRPIAASPDARSIRPEGLWHRFAPLLVWALIVASAFLLVRLVSRSPHLQAAATPPARPDESLGECRNRCVAGLRLAGWNANSPFRNDVRGADVIFSNGGRMLAVQCHPSMEPVDAGDIEQACHAREIQGSDLAAIVSNASFTEPVRRLAARTGIVLLHEHQLASFAA